MKYLKLIIKEQSLDSNEHITFLYFGKGVTAASVNPGEILSQIKEPFVLTYDKADMFGRSHDIPVHRYSVSSEIPNQVRKMFLKADDRLSRENFIEWTPHISNPSGVRKQLTCIGIESNEPGEFSIMFN